MKHVIIILVSTISFLNCKAQSPIYPLDNWTDKQPNAYYKDLNNDLNAFEGTWLYTNGTTSLKIVLVKKIMSYNGKFYWDLMIGEYQYIENGVEKINTLADLSLNLGYSHKITGNSIYSTCTYLPIDDCIDGEKRLGLSLVNPGTRHYAEVTLHKRVVNGQQALKAYMSFTYIGPYDETGDMPNPTMPWQGIYTLIKQRLKMLFTS